jgi:hypothetical protein
METPEGAFEFVHVYKKCLGVRMYYGVVLCGCDTVSLSVIWLGSHRIVQASIQTIPANEFRQGCQLARGARGLQKCVADI